MGLKELVFGKQIKQAHAAQYRNSTQGWTLARSLMLAPTAASVQLSLF